MAMFFIKLFVHQIFEGLASDAFDSVVSHFQAWSLFTGHEIDGIHCVARSWHHWNNIGQWFSNRFWNSNNYHGQQKLKSIPNENMNFCHKFLFVSIAGTSPREQRTSFVGAVFFHRTRSHTFLQRCVLYGKIGLSHMEQRGRTRWRRAKQSDALSRGMRSFKHWIFRQWWFVWILKQLC